MRWLLVALPVASALLLSIASGACAKGDSGEPDEWTAPPVMEMSEQQRGTVACATYVKRLCGCAETHDSLKDQCRLAQQQPEALALLLGMMNGEEGRLGRREVREAQHSARRIIKDCFEKEASLDPSVCPR